MARDKQRIDVDQHILRLIIEIVKAENNDVRSLTAEFKEFSKQVLCMFIVQLKCVLVTGVLDSIRLVGEKD